MKKFSPKGKYTLTAYSGTDYRINKDSGINRLRIIQTNINGT